MAPSQELEDAIYSPTILGRSRRPAHRTLSLCLSGGLYLLMAAAGYWIETRRAPEGPRPAVVTVSFDLMDFAFPPSPPVGGAAVPSRSPEPPANPPDAASPDQTLAEAPTPETVSGPAAGLPATGPSSPMGQEGGAPGGAVGGSPGGEVGSLLPPVFNAAYLNNPAPTYPALSRRLKEEGRVLLKVLVGPDGRPERVGIHQSSGHARLDEAALATVARWRFVPARRGAESFAATVIVPIRYQLETQS